MRRPYTILFPSLRELLADCVRRSPLRRAKAEGVGFLLARNFAHLWRRQNFSFATRVFKNIKQFMFLKYPSNPFHHITKNHSKKSGFVVMAEGVGYEPTGRFYTATD